MAGVWLLGVIALSNTNLGNPMALGHRGVPGWLCLGQRVPGHGTVQPGSSQAVPRSLIVSIPDPGPVAIAAQPDSLTFREISMTSRQLFPQNVIAMIWDFDKTLIP
ncbi:MAG: hypothetical protein L0Z63_10875, partial [Actinobacteria bacterium]|nr:hypothetical protein [Actinomycetota bacterium]